MRPIIDYDQFSADIDIMAEHALDSNVRVLELVCCYVEQFLGREWIE